MLTKIGLALYIHVCKQKHSLIVVYNYEKHMCLKQANLFVSSCNYHYVLNRNFNHMLQIWSEKQASFEIYKGRLIWLQAAHIKMKRHPPCCPRPRSNRWPCFQPHWGSWVALAFLWGSWWRRWQRREGRHERRCHWDACTWLNRGDWSYWWLDNYYECAKPQNFNFCFTKPSGWKPTHLTSVFSLQTSIFSIFSC